MLKGVHEMSEGNNEIIIDQAEMGKQLRKPEGDIGKTIGGKMNEGNIGLYRLALSMIRLGDNNNLLEIGFGNGKFINEYFLMNPSISVTGLDFSETMCEEANKNNEDLTRQGKVRFMCANAQNMPFDDESFDIVIALNTIYFWNPIESYLNEIKRVIKKGGSLLIGYRPKKIMENLPFINEGFTLLEPIDVRNVLGICGFNIIDEEIKNVTRKTIDGTTIDTIDICVLAKKE